MRAFFGYLGLLATFLFFLFGLISLIYGQSLDLITCQLLSGVMAPAMFFLRSLKWA